MSRYGRAAAAVGIAMGLLCLSRADPPAGERSANQALVRTAPSDVLSELDKLVKADVATLEKVAAAAKDSGQPAPIAASEKPVVMSPYIVRDMKDVNPVGRTPHFTIGRLLEDGVLFDPGRNSPLPFLNLHPYTVYAPQGIANNRPSNGVELIATWSW
jgi:hypothetical protein